MNSYEIAWWVIGISAVVGAASFWVLLGYLRFGLLRWLMPAVAIAFFCAPVRVPNYEPQLAPAFLVATFELFFQIDGQAQASLRMLGIACSVVAVVVTILYFAITRLRGRTTSSQT